MEGGAGVNHIRDPLVNRSSSTPIEDRTTLNIRGLIPAGYMSLERNVARCMEQLRMKSSPLEKYLFVQGLQNTDERLYYALLVCHTAEMMPIVYTPTVGEACQKWSHIYNGGSSRGLYLSLDDTGNIRSILNQWPQKDKVTTIVITDGERILGLGDLGVNGMGIPIGKLALYTAVGGIHPSQVLPVQIDTGTDNPRNLEDPYYLGLKRERERGPAYDHLIAEFFDAAQEIFSQNVLIQFEDFGNRNAFRLLHKFQNRACTFNDDIQGTASVALAGLLASNAITGKKSLSDHTFLFNGAGEAGTGIADLIAYAISIESNSNLQDARSKIYLVDSKGLVTKKRISSLQHHKLNYAHDIPEDQNHDNLLSSINLLRPSVLIGVSAVPKSFDKVICETMASINETPIIFALSNPTSKAECTAEEAYTWTNGKAVFSSGSPFAPVTLDDGHTFVPGQGNNAYIFPGVGLGALAAGSSKITDHDMFIAAKSLASQVTSKELDVGCVYPPLSQIRSVSAQIAADVACNAYDTNVATNMPRPENMLDYVQSIMYDPMSSD